MAGYISQGSLKGPASSTDNAISRYDGTAGNRVQNSTVTISDVAGGYVTLVSTDNFEIQPADDKSILLDLKVTDAAAAFVSLETQFDISPTSNNAQQHYGHHVAVVHTSGYDLTGTPGLTGMRFSCDNESTGTVAYMNGFESDLINVGGGTVTRFNAYTVQYENDNTLTNLVGFYFEDNDGVGAPTNTYGLAFENTNQWISNDGLKISTDNLSTTKYIPISQSDKGLHTDNDILLEPGTDDKLDINTAVSDAGSAWIGVDNTASVTTTSNNAFGHTALKNSLLYSSNNNVTGTLIGTNNVMTHSGSGTLTTMAGSLSNIGEGGTGTTSTVYGFYSTVSTLNASATITNLYDFAGRVPTNTGTITNRFGLGLSHGASATNTWLLDYDSDFLSTDSLKVTPDAGTTTKYIRVSNTATHYSTNNISSPPTDAELDTAFGDPTTLESGFIGIIDDNDAGTDCWIVWTTGTAGEWFYEQGTKAV